MSKKSIWDDSECTLEEEYITTITSKSPNPTIEFRNTLISNKGDITSARKLNLETVKLDCVHTPHDKKNIKSLSDVHKKAAKIFSIDRDEQQDSENYEDVNLKIVFQRVRSEKTPTAHAHKNNKSYWKELSAYQRVTPSMEILKKMLI